MIIEEIYFIAALLGISIASSVITHFWMQKLIWSSVAATAITTVISPIAGYYLLRMDNPSNPAAILTIALCSFVVAAFTGIIFSLIRGKNTAEQGAAANP